MNNRMKGFYRDKAIIRAVEQYKCLNTEQIQCLLFGNMKSGLRKCQQRLKRLTDRGKLKRWRYDLEEPYAYYITRLEQMEHTILLNWSIIWIKTNLKSWEEIYSFEYEVKKYPMIRPDAFVAIENKITSKFKFIYIEMDRAESANRFDKVRKYNDLYESNKFKGEWWVKLTKRFPPIILVTTEMKRLKKIEKHIERENRNGLEFIACLVDDLRKEVLSNEIVCYNEA